MYTFGAARFPMFNSIRSSAKEVQTRNAGFSWTLLVVLLFSLFPATVLKPGSRREWVPKSEVARRQQAAASIFSVIQEELTSAHI